MLIRVQNSSDGSSPSSADGTCRSGRHALAIEDERTNPCSHQIALFEARRGSKTLLSITMTRPEPALAGIEARLLEEEAKSDLI